MLAIAIGVSGRMHIGALYPPADESAKPAFAGAAWMLAPWPTVTRQQPPPATPLIIDHRSAAGPAAHIGPAHLSVATDHPGVVMRTPPRRPPAGDQVVVVLLGREPAPVAPDRIVADVAVRLDGVTAVRHVVVAGELRSDGRMRGIPLTVTVGGGQRAQLVVHTTGAAPLRVGDVQMVSPVQADSGLAQTGDRYPDAWLVAVWGAVSLGLAAVIAVSLGSVRPGRRRRLAPPSPALPAPGLRHPARRRPRGSR